LVEDDLAIADVVADFLCDAGYEVTTAASAEEAWVILAQSKFDLLFTDINLGGGDGFDLAERAVRSRPGLKVMYASGRSRRLHNDRSVPGSVFLQKPYRLELLAGEMASLLDKKPH
jgi:DNA-binding response OmpR family regulator